MASHSNIPHWQAPKFTFSTAQQWEEWKVFYTRAINFLEAFDINTEKEDSTQKGWKQLKMIFEGKDRQTLQTLINNWTISPEKLKTPQQVLHAIITKIKSEGHFWNSWY